MLVPIPVSLAYPPSYVAISVFLGKKHVMTEMMCPAMVVARTASSNLDGYARWKGYGVSPRLVVMELWRVMKNVMMVRRRVGMVVRRIANESRVGPVQRRGSRVIPRCVETEFAKGTKLVMTATM
jgi:hypothetical protein